MKKTKNEMLAVIEKLREDKFPDLPADLVARIIETEADFMENQVEACKRVGQLVDQYIPSEGER
ncbi:MAG: hypothetical protein NTZ28_12490 [Nitrospirae bacterium]|nr:hypothetical protein [Nitrospirota bacterium]MCX7020639.1 hypothetical protein [Candidatus Sumerlaeota bacterium]